MTRKTPARTALSLSVLALLVTATALYAGPLTPPVGPVAPTAKPLAEVEPRVAINLANTPGDADSLFRITQPGSYYLTGNVTGVAGKHGIEIAASGVTIDLNGFDLVGVPAMGAFDGVTVTVANLVNIAVRNGSVRDWGDEGVDFGTINAINSRVENIRASGNAGNGIRAGDGAVVASCTAFDNASSGINAGSGCAITACTAYANILNGIFTGPGCTVANCTAYNNSGSGISVGSGSTVTDCSLRVNTTDGIVCSSACVIRGNICSTNGNGGEGAGIRATGSDNRIEGNNCTGADRGIDVVGAGNIIIKNSCSGNTSNWEIAAGNICLVVLATPTTAAISGDSGGLSPGSTNPNANFTY